MYQILLTALTAGLSAQFIKPLFKKQKTDFNWRDLYAYSGMPSAHAAFVVSLAAIIGLKEGVSSTAFAVAFIMALLIIRDALGVRRYVGQHGEILNSLIKDLKIDQAVLGKKYPPLNQQVGHTPAQIAAGAAFGLTVGLLSYFIFH